MARRLRTRVNDSGEFARQEVEVKAKVRPSEKGESAVAEGKDSKKPRPWCGYPGRDAGAGASRRLIWRNNRSGVAVDGHQG